MSAYRLLIWALLPAAATALAVAQTGEDPYRQAMAQCEEAKQKGDFPAMAAAIRQALKQMPQGDFRAKVGRIFKPPAGEVYARVESPRGELGCYLLSDGSDTPARFHWRAPSFANLQALPTMARGGLVADMVAVLGSIDIVLGDVDR